MPRALITVSFNHTCEKARWALDHAVLDYVEERHLPILHLAATFRAGAGRSVPVLVTEDQMLSDTSAIVHYADRHAPLGRKLYPESRRARMDCDVLEEWFDNSLAPAVRRVAYHFALCERDLFLEIVRRTMPSRASAGLVAMARAAMASRFRDEARLQRSYEQVWSIFGRVAARLADQRRYLAGDTFSAADLTFAALGAPMVAPEQYGFPMPWNRFPSPAQAMWKEMRQHPAGAFILRLYAEHRTSSSRSSSPAE